MIFNKEQTEDLRRALVVFEDTWYSDFFSIDELDGVILALDEITKGKINYNQFIYKTGVEKMRKFLLM